MLSIIKSDLDRCILLDGGHGTSFAQKLFIIIFAYGFHTVLVYRFGQLIGKKPENKYFLPAYYIALALYSCFNFAVICLYGIEVDRKTIIGKGFYIGHFGGIKVKNCIIGDNCAVHQQVKIGESSAVTSDSVIIGNNVWIGGHSKIMPGVRIENNSTIVVGAVVVKDVKEKTMVMGNPARAIKQNFDNASLMGL